jgi:hypothetical protein
MGLADQCATVDTLLASGTKAQDISRAIFAGDLRINLEQKLTPQMMVYGGQDEQF